MTHIRANCPNCGQVDMNAEAISLEIGDDGEQGRYGFACPACRAEVTKSADRKTVDVLLAIGVRTSEAVDEAGPRSLPAEDQNPCPQASAFSMDDLIDLHFLLQQDAWLADKLFEGTDALRT
jgi:hypothetical protein